MLRIRRIGISLPQAVEEHAKPSKNDFGRLTLHPSQVSAPKWNPEERPPQTRQGMFEISRSEGPSPSKGEKSSTMTSLIVLDRELTKVAKVAPTSLLPHLPGFEPCTFSLTGERSTIAQNQCVEHQANCSSLASSIVRLSLATAVPKPP